MRQPEWKRSARRCIESCDFPFSCYYSPGERYANGRFHHYGVLSFSLLRFFLSSPSFDPPKLHRMSATTSLPPAAGIYRSNLAAIMCRRTPPQWWRRVDSPRDIRLSKENPNWLRNSFVRITIFFSRFEFRFGSATTPIAANRCYVSFSSDGLGLGSGAYDVFSSRWSPDIANTQGSGM